MKVPEPWLRRIRPCSNNTSSALRAVTREMPSSFAQIALRRHGLFGFPLAGMDRRFQIARQLQVQRRGLGVVGA